MSKEKSDKVSSAPADGQGAVSSGRVEIFFPHLESKPAQVEPGEHIRILINGQPISQVTSVQQNDEIIVETIPDPASTTCQVEIAPDQMQASVTLVKKEGHEYRVLDAMPASHLIVQAQLHKQTLAPINPNTIKENLAQAGVSYGIDQKKIEEVCRDLPDEPVVIANGYPGQPPVDEKIVYLFDQPQHQQGSQQDRIDFREMNQIIAVTTGDRLAKRVPAVAGKDAIKVTGRKIPVRPTRPCPIKPGKGVTMSEDGQYYLATTDGQPEIKGRSLLVAAVFQIKSVDIRSGHVRFPGQVIINQDVAESMLVDAKSSIRIMGCVNRARITASEDIEIAQSAIGSQIQAGGQSAVNQSIISYFQDIKLTLEQLAESLHLMQQSFSEKGTSSPIKEGQMIKILIEKKFPQLEVQINNLTAFARQRSDFLDKETLNLINLLETRLLGMGSIQLTGFILAQVALFTGQITGQLLTVSSQPGNILIGYTQNCQLDASGDIIIRGKGCYNSELTAGGSVRLVGQPGIFRGGQIRAGGDVEAGEIGSQAEIATQISAGRGSQIKARTIYPNVTIKFGSFSEKVTAKAGSFTAKLTDQGILTTGYPL